MQTVCLAGISSSVSTRSVLCCDPKSRSGFRREQFEKEVVVSLRDQPSSGAEGLYPLTCADDRSRYKGSCLEWAGPGAASLEAGCSA